MHQLMLKMLWACAGYNVGDGVRMRQVQLKEMVCACARCAEGNGVRMRQTQLKKMQLTCAGDC